MILIRKKKSVVISRNCSRVVEIIARLLDILNLYKLDQWKSY